MAERINVNINATAGLPLDDHEESSAFQNADDLEGGRTADLVHRDACLPAKVIPASASVPQADTEMRFKVPQTSVTKDCHRSE